MTEQERFEAYIAKRTLMPANLTKISTGSTDYADRTIQMHWITWQASQQKEVYQGIPGGYVLVPVDPSEKMIKAAYQNYVAECSDALGCMFTMIYQVMIEAVQEVE